MMTTTLYHSFTRPTFRHALTATLLLTISTLSTADSAVSAAATSFSASYKANIKGFAVNAKRELKVLDNGLYQLSFRAKSWAAKLDEISTFSLDGSTIQPANYQFTQSALGKKRERSLTFDRAEQRISSTEKDNTQDISNIDNAALDKLNYQLQLQFDLLNNKSDLQYQIADKGRLKSYRFDIVGEETLDTALGSLTTVKVNVIRENANKVTHIWFAKDWSYLLVQLKQFEGDKQKLSIKIHTATVNNTTVAGL
jgi:hypothetical protein